MAKRKKQTAEVETSKKDVKTLPKALINLSQDDRRKTVKEILSTVYWPFATIEQNVIWYIKQKNAKITYSDLTALKPWLKTLEDFTKAIDKL